MEFYLMFTIEYDEPNTRTTHERWSLSPNLYRHLRQFMEWFGRDPDLAKKF
jgi:hypothetical protein